MRLLAYKFCKTDTFQRGNLGHYNTLNGALFDNIKGFQAFQGQCSDFSWFSMNLGSLVCYKKHLPTFAWAILTTCLVTAIWLNSNKLYVFSKICYSYACAALRDLVPFVQYKKRENTHGRVLLLVKLQANTLPLLKVTLLHGYFLRFLNCTNGTKSRTTSHTF